MSKKRDADFQEQLNRIEGKLDEMLAFRDAVNSRIEGLMGSADGALTGLTGALVSNFLQGGIKG